jgi:hypothetical protein
MYVCHSQGNKGNKNFFSLFLHQASKQAVAACGRKERKNIYMPTICVRAYACSALSVYVFVLALSYKTLHGRRRHIYNVKQKEREGRHSLLLALSHRLFSLPSYSPSPPFYAHTHTHSDYCLTRTLCKRQASK